MQTSHSHTPYLNGTPTIQPVEELVEVKIEVNCELIVPAHFHPANHGTDHHFLRLDSGRIVQISKGKDIIVLALAKIYLQELDGKELDIEKCLYYAKSAADKGHPEGAALYSFVSCTQLMKRKGILTGEEDTDEIMETVMQAAMDGDEDAIAFLA